MDGLGKQFLLVLKLHPVMVPDDIIHPGLLHTAGHPVQMVKALIPFLIHRILICRKQRLEFPCHEKGISHTPLGRARMDIGTMDRHPAGRSIKVFVLQLSQRSAVHSVSPISPKAFHIKAVGSPAHLLVRREADTDRPVLYFRMPEKISCHGHDFSDTCLIIRSQQSGPIRGNQGLALIFL